MDWSNKRIIDLLNWESVKDLVLPRLISIENNRGLLNTVPYQEFLDVAEIFYMKIPLSKEESRAITVNRFHLEAWKIDEKELHRMAMYNMRMEETVFFDLAKFGQEIERERGNAIEFENPTYVLTIRNQGFGAARILDAQFLGRIAEELKDNLIILPTSVSEVLVLEEKKTDKEKYEIIRKMVRNINEEELPSKAVLSDNLYFFDRETWKISVIHRKE